MSKLFLENNQSLIYGKHSVFAALLNKSRKIHQLLITKNNKIELEKFFNKHKVKLQPDLIQIIDGSHLSNIFPENLFPSRPAHQGVILKTSPTPITSHNDFFNKNHDTPNLLILDNLTDPQNIGAIIRSAAAFGFNKICVSERNFPAHSPVIAKAASGMLEIVELISFQNLNNFLKDLKKIGYWSAGLAGEATATLEKARDFKPLALVIGSEGDGIRKLVKENCDLLVKIPMHEGVESLNVSNASAIAMYELNRK
ncbi:MAG: 23S rRNA (guanosine2251-2'-O)-methyltransferase [Lentimonas sp.]|jgi:23S rRNA (guanosine2251-2'-O)-methyltransferase